MKKSLKITLIVLGSIIGFVFLLFAIVSLFGGSIAKNYVNKHSQELLGRQANIEHVGINLFNGHVAVNGLCIFEENGKDSFAGFDTLDISVSLFKLIGHTVYVRHITLAGLNVNVLQNGDRFNFSSIIDHFASDSTEVVEEEVKDTTPSNWIISLHNIRLANGSASYTDVPKDSHFGFKNLSILVPDFAIGGQDKTDAGITLDLDDGGKLKIDAKYQTATNDFSVILNLSNFSLEQVKPYVTDIARIDQINGRLNVDATVNGNLDQIMAMEIGANASLDGVDVMDESHRSVAQLQHLGVNVDKVVLEENLFDIASVELNGLSAKYELFADSSNTISRLLKPSEPTATTTAASEPDTAKQEEKPMKLNLRNLNLSGINLTYADHTMPDDFVFPITNLRITATDLTTTGNNNAKVFANLPNGAILLVDWAGNISDWKLNQSIRLNIKNVHLTDLSPYAVAYIGQPITDGIFSFTSHNTIHNSQLNGKNRIDIYKPTIGDRRKDVKAKLKLPIKAALYILKDKDEKVVLDVPIAGNIDSPEFNYMKLVWKTLGNLVVKVATSPARALGNLFGSHNDELFITIDPSDNDFTSEQYYQIDKVADLARTDENYHLQLNLETKPTQDSTIAQNHRMRNQHLLHHLKDLGIAPEQFSITTAQPSDSISRQGYSVTLELKEESQE